ncbi:MAG: S8 family peptidase [bacterium]
MASSRPVQNLSSPRTLAAVALMTAACGAALFGSSSAQAALREYRVQFEPSPSSEASGYTLHIGEQSRSYSVEFDLGAPPASGGTIVYAVDLEDTVDLFVALQTYDESGSVSPFSNEIQVSAVESVPSDPPVVEPVPENPPAEEPLPEDPPVEEPAPSDPPSELHLDEESDAIRQDVLEQTLVDARSVRSLYVTPGLIDRVSRDGSAWIVFDTAPDVSDEAAATQQIVDVLSGTTDGGSAVDAVWGELRVFPVLARAAARVGPEALRRLIAAGFVERIEADALHRPALESSTALVGATAVQQSGFDGAGRVIALLDTGVDASHPMLAGRVIEEACFSRTGDCPNGEREMFGPGAGAACSVAGCAHGTRVAGVAAGDDEGLGLTGVAPGASLISVQVFSEVDGSPGAFTSDLLAGLQHVLSLTAFYDVAVVNLSLGSELQGSEASCDEAGGAQREAIGLLRDAGVATVAAAGNGSRSDALAMPACLSNVIAVGASTELDEIAAFSNSADFLSLLAPGESIETANLGGGTAVASGTSLAAAHVSGAIAALREETPEATVAEIDNVLRLTGSPILDERNGVTTPRLDVAAASEVLSAQSSASGPTRPAAAEATAASSSGSGLSDAVTCGLIGIEPFMVLGLVRLMRRSAGRRLAA